MGQTFSSAGALAISIDTPSVYAGQMISGRVFAHIEKPVECTTLQLEIFGEEYSHVHWTTQHCHGSGKNRKCHTKHHHAYARRSLMYIDVALANFGGGTLQPGSYEFPFQAQLAANLPSSMCAYGGGGDCKIRYGVKARLHRPGWTKWDLHASAPIQVSATPLPPVAVPAFVEPNEQEINMCCCINQGKMMFGAGFDDTLVSRGQTFGFGVACKNNSSRGVDSVTCTIYERVSWSARGHRNGCMRKVANVQLPASEIAGTGALDKEALKAVAENAEGAKKQDYLEIYNTLTSGQQRSSLTISPDARDTYIGQVLHCSHQMNLTLMTGCCITDPSVDLEVRIGPPPLQAAVATAVAVQAMGVPVVPMPEGYALDEAEQANKQMLAQHNVGWTPVVADVAVLPMGNVVLGGVEVQGMEAEGEAAAAPPPPVVMGAAVDVTGELEKLAQLREQGILNDEEFEAAKNKALNLSGVGSYKFGGGLQAGTYEALKKDLDANYDDLAMLETKVDEPEWQHFFANLEPLTYGSIIGEVNLEFKQPQVAELLASRLVSGLSCQHVAAAVRSASKSATTRSNIVEKVLPRVVDKANCALVVAELTSWEQIVCIKTIEACQAGQGQVLFSGGV